MNKILLFFAGVAMICAAPCRAANADSIPKAPRAPEIITSAVMSMGVNAGITEALKAGVHRMRPDGSSDNSFPSRHTSWAFAASTVVSIDLYRHSPWWSFGAQMAATAVGIQRVHARRHYGSDVIAGAAVGVVSAELSSFICRKIFGTPSVLAWPQVYDDFRPQLAMFTEGVYHFDSSISVGFGGGLDFRMPLSEHWGLGAVAAVCASPVDVPDRGLYPLETASLAVGPVAHFPLAAGVLALDCDVRVGAAYARVPSGYDFSRANAACRAGVGLDWRLTKAFSTRLNIGYSLIAGSAKADSGLAASVSSVVVF